MRKEDFEVFNVSEGRPNFSQRNNAFTWSHKANPKLKMNGHSMCNVTSIVMALAYLGWSFPKGRYIQAEDNLCEFIFTDERVLAFYKKSFPREYSAFERGDTNALCPNLIHAILAYATNLWMGREVMKFNFGLPTEAIIGNIKANKPVVISGAFPYKYLSGKVGTLNHINVLVGVAYKKTSYAKNPHMLPDYLIIDDPYGNFNDNFVSKGNDVWIPYKEFMKKYKPFNNNAKWCHTFKSFGE